jgi:hypothetical protein
MKGWILTVLAVALSGCGPSSSDPEQTQQGQAQQETQQGAFEAYTDSQAKALKKAKGVEDTLKKADAERRKQLEQMQ